MAKKVLHVGCGQATIKNMPSGFNDGTWQEVRYDIAKSVKPDIIGSMQDMSAVETGSVDALFSAHNIEHVFAHEVVPVLKEFRRALKDDGFCIITCPDIEMVCRLVAKNGKLAEPLYQSPAGPITALDIIYGHTDSIAQGSDFMAHKTGFSAQILLKRLEDAGFAKIYGQQRPSKLDMWFIAYKNDIALERAKESFGRYTGVPLKGSKP